MSMMSDWIKNILYQDTNTFYSVRSKREKEKEREIVFVMISWVNLEAIMLNQLN